MSHNKPVLLIGGPADGQRIIVPMAQRTHNVCGDGLPNNEDDTAIRMLDRPHGTSPTDTYPITVYAIGTVLGAFHEVFHVGVVELNTCIVCELVAGYRKPRKHSTDANVAKQLVTLLGGSHDGQHTPASEIHDRVAPGRWDGDRYQIVPLICKDGTVIRVGVLDMMVHDPIQMLIEGYRMGAPA
jgi:hypothetical protein